MSTPVSDEDLEFLDTWADETPRGPLVDTVRAVVHDLRALRKVADAAKDDLLQDWADEDDNGIATRLDVIELRLRDAGRLP